MLICASCHSKGGYKYMHFSGSHGRCEICGKVKDCHDCNCPNPNSKKSYIGKWRNKVSGKIVEVVFEYKEHLLIDFLQDYNRPPYLLTLSCWDNFYERVE